jgi:uncharacterized protein YjbI with pentapeptide repeats
VKIYGVKIEPGANLAKANLSRTNLAKVNLTEANLTNANLTFTLQLNANLSGADLIGARMPDGTIHG